MHRFLLLYQPRPFKKMKCARHFPLDVFSKAGQNLLVVGLIEAVHVFSTVFLFSIMFYLLFRLGKASKIIAPKRPTGSRQSRGSRTRCA